MEIFISENPSPRPNDEAEECSDSISRAGPVSRAGLVIVTLGLISAMGSMAIHMLAPALPLLQRSLSTDISGAQMVIGIYLAGLGIGQIFAGPLVDRWGRRQVLYTGLLLFILGSILSVFAPDLKSLLTARTVQAFGGGAGLVVSRVLVADIFGKDRGAGMQASLMMIVLISPAISPIIGSFLASSGGWRLIPALLALIAFFAMLISARALPRSILHKKVAANPKTSLRSDIMRLARNRVFVLTTCALASASAALYMFLSSGAFLLESEYGLNERETGFCFLLIALTSIIGTRLVGWVGRRMDTLIAGNSCILLGSASVFVMATFEVPGVPAIIGPILLLGLGAGMAGPAAIHLTVNAEPDLAGTGASIAGASQMLVSGAATLPLGWFLPISTWKLGLALTLAASISFLAAFLGARHSRKNSQSTLEEQAA